MTDHAVQNSRLEMRSDKLDSGIIRETIWCMNPTHSLQELIRKVFGLFCLVGIFATHAPANIPNFVKVESGLYRGGRPSYSDLTYLARKGVKTILSLEIKSTVKSERSKVLGLGMRFYSIPMSVYYAPRDREMDRIVDILSDPTLRPIFIHCQHGQDRTGLAMGIYRVEVDGWSAAEAYDEMLELDFHPEFEPLDQYFRERTGFSE